ncbi:MAG TPA: NAD(P)/FAD-dependent oxidoreductase [Streptosporangiaceae bacterium]|nr:NAD(P)/FAD-dependent oxidoreductase [Streptosporangiaceae bacterium]
MPDTEQPKTEQDTQPRVVIVGGGFAGLFAARALGEGPFSVTMVDRTAQHVFQPLLYQCATGILSEGQITAPLRQLLRDHRNVDCIASEVVDIDADRRVLICRRPMGEQIEVGYDQLVIAAGVRQSYFGHDNFAALAPGMKTISDALTIRRRVFGAFEMAETAADADEQRRWLTFALVGAGPTGVELAGQIRELATKTLRSEYRKIQPEDARVLLFDGGDAPLATFGKRLSGKAADALRGLGVELQMKSLVTDIDLDGLTVRDSDGNEVRHRVGTVLWTAGVEAPPLAAAVARATGAEQDRCGRIVVQDDLTIPGHPEISVIGDMMSLRKLPGVAEVAMQSGYYTGRRIRRELAGQVTARSFRYRDFGSAAYISRGSAVVSAGPVRLSGFAGWLAWLFIHIGFLTGFRNRFSAVLTWWLAFTLDLRRERAYTTRAVGMARDLYQPLAAELEEAAGLAETPGHGDEADQGKSADQGKVPRPPKQRPAPRRPAGRNRGS